MIDSGRFLLIHTCGSRGFVATADRNAVIQTELLPARGTSEAILPALRRLFPGGPPILDVIGVVNGPGSFTGVRVGLSTAKGLCEAVGCKMVSISQLALIAGGSSGGRVLALLDGGRGELYAGVYEDGRCLSEELVSVAEAKTLAAAGIGITCESSVHEQLGGQIRLVAEPDPDTMLAMLLRRIDAGEWSDVATADANYIRRTDAERLKETS